MADTRQIVQWTLQKRCLLRNNADAETKPGAVAEAVWKARAYSHGLRNREDGFGVFGDIYVSSYTFASLPEGESKNGKKSIHYPTNGFSVAEEFRPFGGVEQLLHMCHECPANVHAHELASCAGDVFQWPESPETETQLRGIISRLGLEKEVAAAFPATRPLWYGLWAVSPVPAKSLPVLRTLLSEILAEDQRDMAASGKVDRDQVRQFTTLIAAIERAESSRLALHVELLPLGHADCGFYTVFSHCPFCKAAARVGRWQRKYPSELHTCPVCGTKFSPAETGSAKRMDWDHRELRDALGEAAYREFAAAYLVERGETPERAAAIVEATEAAEVRRKEMNRQRTEMEARRKQFLEKHVYHGLPCVEPPPPEFPDEEAEAPPERSKCTGWFRAAELVQVLERCEQLGIKVTMLQHHSSDGDHDRFEMRDLKEPLAILAKWRSEGCDEKFYAACRVPDSFVKEPQID
jgi:hypothetical protein